MNLSERYRGFPEHGESTVGLYCYKALELAGDTVYGLGATIWSSDSKKLCKAAKAYNAGIVWMNTNVMSKIEASYGGNKLSGVGREGGVVGLMEYLKCKNNVLYIGPEDNYYGFV